MTSINLPTDTAASRLRKQSATPHPIDDVLDTLREYERLARVATPGYTIASRFTADGETWVPVWLKDEPPAAVHTAVVRDGVATEEWRSWKEALPGEDDMREAWLRNPATRLRAFVERAALRRAFADVIVGREQTPAAVETPSIEGDSWEPATAPAEKVPAPPAPKPVPSPPKQQQGRRRRRAPRDAHLTNSVGDVLRQALEQNDRVQ